MVKKVQNTLVTQMSLINLSLILFGISANIAASAVITGYELSIFRVLNNLSDSLRPLFWTVTQFGSIWGLCAITAVLILTKRYRLSVRLFVTGLAAFILAGWMKAVFVRPRPPYILDDVNIREVALGSGFPSGHAAVATAVTLVLLYAVPKKFHTMLYTIIILVPVSRIYLGVHAPLDVLGGVMLGIIVVISSQIIKGKLNLVTKITGLKLTD